MKRQRASAQDYSKAVELIEMRGLPLDAAHLMEQLRELGRVVHVDDLNILKKLW